MTIVTSVKVRDGLILATDSMTSVQHGGQFIKSYPNARKLFQVKNLPIGVMTFGLGNLGKQSIEGLMIEFCRGLGSSRSLGNISQDLFDFFKAKYDPLFNSLPVNQQPVLGFFVAGYSTGQPFSEEMEFQLPTDSAPNAVRPRDQFGSSWRGINRPFTRLYMGFDPLISDRLQQKGLSTTDIAEVFQDLESKIAYDGMPVQDAINFATYIVDTTIGMSSHEIGVASCGGPLQVAVILPDSGFQWIAKPELSIRGKDGS